MLNEEGITTSGKLDPKMAIIAILLKRLGGITAITQREILELDTRNIILVEDSHPSNMNVYIYSKQLMSEEDIKRANEVGIFELALEKLNGDSNSTRIR